MAFRSCSRTAAVNWRDQTCLEGERSQLIEPTVGFGGDVGQRGWAWCDNLKACQRADEALAGGGFGECAQREVGWRFGHAHEVGASQIGDERAALEEGDSVSLGERIGGDEGRAGPARRPKGAGQGLDEGVD